MKVQSLVNYSRTVFEGRTWSLRHNSRMNENENNNNKGNKAGGRWDNISFSQFFILILAACGTI